jgi:molybdopterin converting factor small subunit
VVSEAEMMRVDVVYFAVLREQRGCRRESVQVEIGTTLSTLYADLFPTNRVPVAYALNAMYVTADAVIQDGDEVCFLPPLGGG